VPSVSHLAPTYLGLDVHKDTIAVAVLAPDRDGPDVERIAHDEASIRRLVGRFPDPRLLRACYEAGPTGYDLTRLLDSLHVRCEVIAPSLIPKAPGDKVKTDRRDCRRLARLHRAGELVAIRIPTVQEEAVRDLCRARADLVQDRTRARHRLGKFLLRHGRVWRGGNAWTLTHERWLLQQRFSDPALAATYAHYRAVLDARDAQLEAIETDLAGWYHAPPFANAVHRLSAYRGVTRLGALTLASEVCDWRRFPQAAAFAGFCGLVPSEYSSGASTRRGHITKTGNAHLRAQLAWVGLGLPAPPGRGGRPARAPARTGPRSRRPRVGRAAAVVRPLPAAGRPQGLQERGRHRDRSGARRVPVGRDAGGLAMTRPAVTLLGAGVTGSCTTRRGAAAAGPIPASTMRRLCRRALSQGHLPASSRPAVSTRVHQCGGSPIHNAPARRADPRARPPPQS
jgi:transposase